MILLTLEQNGFELQVSTYMPDHCSLIVPFKPGVFKGQLHGWEPTKAEGGL